MSFFKSFFEKDRHSNIAFFALTFVYYTIVTQIELGLYQQHFLFLCTSVLAFALTFHRKISTFAIRLLLLSIPYLTSFTRLIKDFEIESDVGKSTMIFLACTTFFVLIFNLYHILKKKYHHDSTTTKDDIVVDSIAKSFQRRCDFHMQDLQIELKRRQLALEIMEYSELGGMDIEPRFPQKDIKTKDIHQQIKKLIEVQKFEKEQTERAEENKRIREFYVEYKETLLSST